MSGFPGLRNTRSRHRLWKPVYEVDDVSTENSPQIAQEGQERASGPHGLSVDPTAVIASHQHDPDAGGCDTRLLALEVGRLRTALERVRHYHAQCVRYHDTVHAPCPSFGLARDVVEDALVIESAR